MEAPTLDSLELVLRLAVAGALGGLVGVEREFSDQPAGLRTHLLVALGSALFTIVGAYGLEAFSGSAATPVPDPTRIAAQVVSGIGFLGAGAILRDGVNIRGLTTAAALWVTASLGVAVGLGYWLGAVAAAAITVIALYGLKQVERGLLLRLRRGFHRFSITMAPTLHLGKLAETLEAHDGLIYSMKIVSKPDGARLLVGYLKLTGAATPEELAAALSEVPGVTEMGWD